MKKLLALAILSTVSLAEPCFGVDFIRDRIYYSFSTNGIDIGYHYTNNVKISIGTKFLFKSNSSDLSIERVLANLRYHYGIKNTDITPYVSIGFGMMNTKNSPESFLYKISSGINLPLSSRTNAFAGYRLLKTFNDYDHGLEFGMSFNL